MRFTFLDPGPLIDRELRLVAPELRWVDEIVRAHEHPLSATDPSLEQAWSRQRLLDFLRAAPQGHQVGDDTAGRVPAYHFWMLADPPIGDPPIRMAGGIGLRIGRSKEIERYSGNLGYHVFPPARGNHVAERSSRLLLSLARRHGMDRLWITCNPENLASRRTCERLGAKLVEIVPVPRDHPFRARGESSKCRYLLELV
jgi:tagatose 1,6-diphosphate aldolase